MRAAIYNPYLDTLGGGERYTFAFAKVLVDKGFRVDVQWKNLKIKEAIEERFGIKLVSVNFIKDIKRGNGYDVCFWVSDGSIPLLYSRRNFLHFQIPFKDVNGRSLLNRMKFIRIEKVICNSYFTKSYIDKEYGVESIVVYPPVDVKRFRPTKKDNTIIFVGRFSQLAQSKNQHILIEVFKKLFDSGYKSWKLVLAGGVEVGVGDYVSRLKKTTEGYPIVILESPKFSKLQELYDKAKIFWSAVGFGIEENKDPKKVEHFGISIIEAMAAGVVVFVFSAGGHREIVDDGVNGFMWKKKNDLIKKTIMLINNQEIYKKVVRNARQASKIYELERFETEISNLF